MPWLRCTVEQISRKTDGPIVIEVEGRSAYECAWAALCEWCMLWHFDSKCQVLTVRHGERVWRVRQEKVSAWRPVVQGDTARRMLHEAKLRDPEGIQPLT